MPPRPPPRETLGTTVPGGPVFPFDRLAVGVPAGPGAVRARPGRCGIFTRGLPPPRDGSGSVQGCPGRAVGRAVVRGPPVLWRTPGGSLAVVAAVAGRVGWSGPCRFGGNGLCRRAGRGRRPERAGPGGSMAHHQRFLPRRHPRRDRPRFARRSGRRFERSNSRLMVEAEQSAGRKREGPGCSRHPRPRDDSPSSRTAEVVA